MVCQKKKFSTAEDVKICIILFELFEQLDISSFKFGIDHKYLAATDVKVFPPASRM
jgi:hypothetical protein